MTLPSWITASGSLGSVSESSVFTYSLSYSGTLPITAAIISGTLPVGLSMDDLGNITGTVGFQTTLINSFTVRLTNTDGIADRTFSITVSNTVPTWTDAQNFGNYPVGALFDFSFFVNDPSGDPIVFEKIAGELPPGLFLNPIGRLYGIIDSPNTYTYNFTIQATTQNGLYILDRAFTIHVLPSSSTQPVWLTPAGIIADILANIAFSQAVIAEMPTGGAITYVATGLPPGVTIDTATGIISGTITTFSPEIISFSVVASFGSHSSSRIFSFNANNDVVYALSWITSAGSIGSIKEGYKSLLSVKAQSSSPWIRYVLSSGSLPLGLSIDINTGEIQGLVQQQSVINETFDFTVEAYNDNLQIYRNFSIELLNNYLPGATRAYLTLYGADKLNYVDLFTSQSIIINDIFQDGNPTFGVENVPKILLCENLNYQTADQIAALLSGVRRTYLNLGKVEVGQAVINNQVVYDVLYRRIFDDSAGALQQYVDPITLQTIKPGSLTNIRNRLIAVGFSGNDETLPLWMASEQIIGDPSSIPGWMPVIEFIYMNPGTGNAMAQQINSSDVQLKKLFMNRVRIDRLICEPAADTYFTPFNILFDNMF